VAERDHFRDEDARAAWNEGARAWEDFVESGKDHYRHQIHGPALLSVCGPLAGRRVLDLGCGQGHFTRQLAQRGASVVGVDISEGLLAFAQEHEAKEPLGIEYHLMSAADVQLHFAPGSFDLITACFSLHDMADPKTALKSAHGVLRPGERMVVASPHPCTDTPYREWEISPDGSKGALKIDHYFDSGPAVLHWNMRRLTQHWDAPYWRHTLSEWSAMIAQAGFLIRRMHEPRPTAEQVRRNPHIEDAYRVPYALIYELVKG
jgi:2-polyprenyl-3-methyl-5-hydroxy-6-metoxy-1,4-benzoquinol methylase